MRTIWGVCGLMAWFALFTFAGMGRAEAVVQWARQYKMTCEGCHTAFPRLNAVGVAFKLNGYRFTSGEVAKLSWRTLRDYIGPTWSPSLTLRAGSESALDGRGVRVHLGGAVGANAAFLVQPITGSAADFNMAQGILTFGKGKDQMRLVAGRLYAWANGGGIGGADRFLTASAPLMIGSQRGVNIGGLGHGARLEYLRDRRTLFSVFATDMAAVPNAEPAFGVSLSRLLDSNSSSALELFAGWSDALAPDGNRVPATRYGLFLNRALLDKTGRERWNFLTGVLTGANSGVNGGIWSGFFEADWSPSSRLTLFARQDWIAGAAQSAIGPGLTLGAAIPLNQNLRLDADLLLPRANYSAPQVQFRLRLVY